MTEAQTTLLHVHENNIDNKISQSSRSKGKIIYGYKGLGNEFTNFKNEVYLPFRKKVEALTFDENTPESFKVATVAFNEYYNQLLSFSKKHKITAQSKFESTFLEEMSCYLFKDLPEIKFGTLGIFNKGIYAGLKIDSHNKIAVITKDVDFCIGKKVSISIDDQKPTVLILPVVAVEVKTYMDKTMFGEIKSSSQDIRSASPHSKAYVLTGHKSIKDEPIIAARQDSMLTEIFVLREKENAPMDAAVVFDYWQEIRNAVKQISIPETVNSHGRLLKP